MIPAWTRERKREGLKVRGGYEGWRVANGCQQISVFQLPSIIASQHTSVGRGYKGLRGNDTVLSFRC